MNKLKKITTILEHLDNADMNMKTTITSLTLLMVLLYVVTTTFCECSANPANQPQQQQSSNATTQNHYKIVGPNTSIGPILGWKTSPFMETLYIIMAFFLIIFVFRLLWAFLPKRLHFLHAYVPESGLLIVIGMIIGGFVALAKAHQFNDVLTFNESIFFLLLVPPIIFQSGYSLHKSFFFRNIGLILLYAFLGTFLDAMFLSLTLWGFSHIPGLFNVKYELLQLFMFGAAVSSVDPVAILTVFEDVKVNERLNIIILGQSVINDAVAAVLSGLFTSLYLTEVLSGAPVTITGEHVGLAIAKLLWMSLGAVIVGSLVAFIGLFLSRFSNRIVVLECTIVMLVPWATYLFSESLLVSGIIGVLCCGIILSNYLGLNMTEKNQETASTVLKLFSLMLEAMIFLYIGVSIVAIPLHWDGFFILFALVFTILFRYVIIFGLTGIYNLVETVRKTNRTVSIKNQFIIAYGGLRGAIAFALIFVIPSNEVFKRSFLSAILVIILFTVFVMGGTIGLLLKLLRIPGMSRSQQETRDAIQRNMNSIKEYEALIYRALNSLKRFRDKKEEGWNDSRETLRLTSTKIEQLISILKKDGTIDFQNQQHLTPRNVIALRRNAKRQVVSSWSTFLKGQPVENLPNAVLAVHRVFETISKVIRIIKSVSITFFMTRWMKTSFFF
ncbi:hypothetical protein C9374_004728 [Naegleria lovaniensis]|uniref:Sodium/hydrogen exchanger n=1 Tax=Naegleria lovaniensis TaxID=51637 RepID=A0AA88KNM7_NAELO|nr:uncharacterized protein C9374_004728 [Naegleria lovaniensis]KAG2382761.1 hypothetical protein C9374_004728 [Naegleria lovaniensis]